MIVSPHHRVRARIVRFIKKVSPKSLRERKISAPWDNIGEILGVEKKFPTPSVKTETYDFRNFLCIGSKLNWLKTLKI